MLKRIILIALFIALISPYVAAEETIQQDKILISLIYPGASGQAMKAPRSIPKPIEISGQIFLDISPAPSNIRKDRYLVEYFLGDKLIYKTTGFDNASGSISFSYIFDTTKYENGRYKLMVNFWDVKGPSAIGAREVFINNSSGE